MIYGYGQIAIYWMWHGYAILKSKGMNCHGCDNEESKQPAEAFGTDVDRYEEIQTQKGRTKLGAMDCQDQVEDCELLLEESATIALFMDQDSRTGVTLSAKDSALMVPFDASECQVFLGFALIC
ncbi:hypothetical protein O181_096069 [Austropuccinia psidii MF-1]|uniref:Uncharacterized protein n=1 Tax=Austropuccinia psidii MF-1 TaxID=1389203 RepID=A0A9Q3PCC3_9BASI|nr:hypothetical protein [Austropuccinia psidii MF-1]